MTIDGTMQSLRHRELSALVRFVADLYAPCDLDGFRSHVLTAVKRLVPCRSIVYNEVDLRSQVDTWLCDPIDALTFPDSQEIFNEHLPEHPVIAYQAHHGDSRVQKISDFLTQRQLHDLGLYQEFFKRVGTEYQLACTLARDPLLIGVVLNRRDRDFTERERTILTAASSHIIQAHRNASELTMLRRELTSTRSALEESGRAIILLTHSETVKTETPLASRWLEQYFGRRRHPSRLPDVLDAWVRTQKDRLVRLEPLLPLIVEKEARLTVRLFPGDDQTMLMMTQETTTIAPESLRALNLSARETDVLALVANGRSNVEIGAILGMSARTVQKHLEHIFQKLGVENRTAAAMRAWRTANSDNVCT
jgi:DNA-binding CsgD family transcriptional regulator